MDHERGARRSRGDAEVGNVGRTNHDDGGSATMNDPHPTRVIDPVCGMAVDVAGAEAAGLTLEYGGRTYAFCRAGCRRAFAEDPEPYAARAVAAAATAPPAASEVGRSSERPVIDEGMRRWYESCPCCLSDAYPEIKAALDAERAERGAPPVEPGICEVAEAADAAATREGVS